MQKYGSSSFDNKSSSPPQMSYLPNLLLGSKSHNHKKKQFFIEGTVVDKGNSVEKTRKLQSRISSFNNRNWTSKKSKYALACAGFRYTGDSDRVECDDCSKRVYKWSEDDDPLETHFRIAPDCPFIVELGYTLDHQIPKYSRYANYSKRLASMIMVPEMYKNELPSYDSLAKSGFFYQGTLDRMCCFHCGLVLRDWEKDTVPNEVHEQFQKKCLFITNLMELERTGECVELKLKKENKENVPKASKNVQNRPIPRTTCHKAADRLDLSKMTASILPLEVADSKSSRTNRESSTDAQRSDAMLSSPCIPRQPTDYIRFRPIGKFAVKKNNKLIEQDMVDNVDGKSSKKSHVPERPKNLNTSQQISSTDLFGTPTSPVITPIEQAVHEMGYSLELIQQAINERRERGEGEFPDATSLCLAVMDLAEEVNK